MLIVAEICGRLLNRQLHPSLENICTGFCTAFGNGRFVQAVKNDNQSDGMIVAVTELILASYG